MLLLKAYQKYKIRMQMIFANIIISIIPVLVLGVIFYSMLIGNSNDSITKTMELLFAQLNGRASEFFVKTDKFTQAIAYNIHLQELIINNDVENPIQKQEVNQYLRIYNDLDNALAELFVIKLPDFFFTNSKINPPKKNDFTIDLTKINRTNNVGVNEELRNYLQSYINDILNESTINDGKIHYYGINLEGKPNKDFFFGVRVMKYIGKQNAPYNPIAAVVYLFDIKRLDSILDNSGMPSNTTVQILDENNKVIVDNGSYINSQNSEISNKNNGKLVINGKTLNLFKTANINMTNWKILTHISDTEIIKETNLIKNFILLSIIGISILVTILTILFNIRITQPLKKLADAFDKFGKGDSKVKLNFETKNELTRIADNFNGMVDDIYSLTHKIFNMQQKLYEAELQKNQFKLFGLQSQINSHFLYNTLNCLRGMARKNAYEEINSIIKNLVAYFRYNMKGSEFVTLAEEIEHMQNYYEIQKTRFGDKFCFIYDVAENIKRQSIIKLSLQPLIENIFLHAFQNKRGIGIIKVKAKRINDIVEIRVMDNGEGIDQKILKELKRLLLIGDDKEIASLKSIGIINIQQRLKIYYGEQSGLRIMSKKGFGTVVIIKMPMKIMEDFTDV